MYGIQAGKLDTLVTFTRRAYVDARGRGPFQPLMTVWAQLVQASGREQLNAGVEVDLRPGTLRIRDSATARGITAGDRVTVHGRDRRITSVSEPGRTGVIEIATTTDLGGS